MQKIPNGLDLDMHYETYGSAMGYQGNLEYLIKELELFVTLPRFRNQLFALIQLYSYSMLEITSVSADMRPVICSDEELQSTLNDLLTAGVIFAGEFYTGSEDIDQCRELVQRNKDTLLKLSSQRTAQRRNLAPRAKAVQNYGFVIQEALDNVEVDIIVPVFSGGIEPACLAGYILEQGEFYNLRYSRRSLDVKDTEVKLIGTNGDIKEKNVFVAEDWVDIGTTATKVLFYIAAQKPSSLFFATPIYSTPELFPFEIQREKNGKTAWGYFAELEIPLRLR